MKSRTMLTTFPVFLATWLLLAPSSARADEVPEKYRPMVRRGLSFSSIKIGILQFVEFA